MKSIMTMVSLDLGLASIMATRIGQLNIIIKMVRSLSLKSMRMESCARDMCNKFLRSGI